MAPPNRRTGFSRRAQYTTFFGYLAGGAGAAIGAGLLLVSLGSPSFMSPARGAAADLAAPASRATAAGKAQTEGFFEAITGYFAAGRQNAELRRELAMAKVRLVEAQAQAEENRRLKALLGLMNENPRPIVVTRLVGSTSTSTRRYATLGAGSERGVAVGMPVRSPRGLVGRIVEVSRSTARVLLVTDGESLVPVRRAQDGVPAFAEGHGDGTLRLRLINVGINPLKVGDVFVTSGSGGLYRPGTPIAAVWRLTSDGAIARVVSDPGANDYVVVEPAWTAAPSGSPPSSEAAALP